MTLCFLRSLLFQSRTMLANEKPAETLANFMASGGVDAFSQEELATGVWVQLADYGDKPNRTPNGRLVTQRFQKEDAEKIVANFGLLAKIRGAPWYEGHPDHAGQVAPALGRTKRLEARDTGLYGLTLYNTAGVEAIRGEAWEGHSIRWECEEAEPGIFRPVRFVSVGFVEEPNMPGLRRIACSNESPGDAGLEQQPGNAGTTETNTMPDWLISQFKELGVITGDETPEEQQAKITAALNKLKPAEDAEAPTPEAMTAANNRIKSLQEELARTLANGHVAAGKLVKPLADQYVLAAGSATTPAQFAATLANMETTAKATAPLKTSSALSNAAKETADLINKQAADAQEKDARRNARYIELKNSGVPAERAYQQACAEVKE